MYKVGFHTRSKTILISVLKGGGGGGGLTIGLSSKWGTAEKVDNHWHKTNPTMDWQLHKTKKDEHMGQSCVNL